MINNLHGFYNNMKILNTISLLALISLIEFGATSPASPTEPQYLNSIEAIHSGSLNPSFNHVSGNSWEVAWPVGKLQMTSDLVNWSDVLDDSGAPASSPYSLNTDTVTKFFRLRFNVIRIIAATGQSNSNGIRWDFDPYNGLTGLDFPFGWKGGQGNRISLPYRPQPDFEAGRLNENMGSLFPTMLGLIGLNSCATEIPRFAALQTGSGGRLSREWKVDRERHEEFVEGVAALTAELNLRYPYSLVILDHVIINQGEANGQNGSATINNLWAPEWLQFIDDITIRYGSQVTFTVEALSTNDSMPSYTAAASRWDVVKAQQLSLDKNSGSLNSRDNVTVIDPDVFITPALVNAFPTSGSAAKEGGYRRDGIHYGALGLNWFGEQNVNFLNSKFNP